MDAVKCSTRIPFLLVLLPILAAAVLFPGVCLGRDSAVCTCEASHHDRFFDGSTLRAWKRTWHGPNALATPLCGYYIPRGCYCNDYAAGCGEAVDESFITNWPADEGCDSRSDCYPAALAVEPRGLERLGQIPNDLELSAGVSGPGGSRAGR